MVYRPKIDPRLAFVLLPFKPPFDSYYEEIIKPAAKGVGLEVRKSDEIYSTRPIIHDIWNQIWAASVVIADVTGKNPNVNYELGICHALGVPTVIITQNLDDVPFDYKHRRCIPYKTEEVDWQRKLKRSIIATLKQVLAGEDVSPELGWPYDTSPFGAENRSGILVAAGNVRDVVIRGSRIVCDALAFAFGPRGTHVSLTVANNQHSYYREGAVIARNLRSSVPLETVGIEHARELATEMHASCGDGSKAAVLVFERLLESGSAALTRGHPRSDLLRGMERAIETAVAAIRSSSKPASDESLAQISRTATNGDTGLADIIVQAFQKAGSDGLVTIERTTQPTTELEVQEGMYFDRGHIDPGLVSEGSHECILLNAYVLIYDLKISSMRDLLPLLEQIAHARRPLLIIADDVEGEALATLVVNNKKGTLNCSAVRAPGFAERRKAILQDIAALTGGAAIMVGEGRRLDSVALSDLGSARKVIVTQDSTTILGGAGESTIGERVKAIRSELSRTKDPMAMEKLRERLAKLSGAIVTIRIGGMSPQDVADRAYQAESAMFCVQNAIEQGTVTGGGASLLHAKKSLDALSLKRPGEIAGLAIVAEAMEEPLRKLVANNGLDPSEIIAKVKRSKQAGVGFNSETGKVQDLEVAGILDPVGTVTRGVQLAYSHARTILQTGAWDAGAERNTNDTAHTDLLELDPQEPEV